VLGRHQQLGRVPGIRRRGGVFTLVVGPGRPPRKPLLSPHRPPRVAPAAPSRQPARERPLLGCPALSYCRRAAPLCVRPHGDPQSGHGAPGGGPLSPRQAQPGESPPPQSERATASHDHLSAIGACGPPFLEFILSAVSLLRVLLRRWLLPSGTCQT
jgi:hypothetical protein